MELAMKGKILIRFKKVSIFNKHRYNFVGPTCISTTFIESYDLSALVRWFFLCRNFLISVSDILKLKIIASMTETNE